MFAAPEELLWRSPHPAECVVEVERAFLLVLLPRIVDGPVCSVEIGDVGCENALGVNVEAGASVGETLPFSHSPLLFGEAKARRSLSRRK